MSKITGLKYVGRQITPNGIQHFWDSGKVISPVDFAEIRGFQTAIYNASNSRERSKASKRLRAWMEEYYQRSGVYAPGAFVAINDDGRILLTAAEYEDELPLPEGAS